MEHAQGAGVTVGPVRWVRPDVFSSCSFHLRITLSSGHGGPYPTIGQLVPGRAAIAGRVVVATEEKVAATMAATTSRVVASLCFTGLSLSAVRRPWTATQHAGRLGGRYSTSPRRGARDQFQGSAAVPSSDQKSGGRHEVQVRTPTRDSIKGPGNGRSARQGAKPVSVDPAI